MLTAERQKLTELAVAASAASASASDIVSSFALKLPARYDSSEVLNIFFGEMPATLAARASCALVGGYSTMPTWSYATLWASRHLSALRQVEHFGYWKALIATAPL